MMKIAFSVAAAATVLFIAPLSAPAKAQGVDVQIGRDRDYRYDSDRDQRRRYESGTTVGVSPGGVTIGQRQRCRTVTTTVERDDGRMIRRKERICD
jgi:Tfp pilus assembly protein PilZ